MTKLNGKDLEVWLKRGMGTTQVAELLTISSSDLFGHIEKSFSRNAARAYKRKLAKNDKAQAKKGEKIDMSEEVVEVVETTVEETELPDDEVTLAELLDEEGKQQEITAQQEIAVKETIQEYRRVLDQVISKSEILTNLTLEIAKIRTEIDQLEESAITALEKHDIELKKLHEEQDKLNQLREEINKRRIINVYLYLDGSISVEIENSSIETEFEGWKEKKELLEEKYDELVCELPLKYIKQLAKLMSLPVLDEQCYELSFESTEVEEAYNKIIDMEFATD